jgi:chitin synthase
MYNEPFKQVLETLAGIYRSYYELVSYDKSYEGKMSIVIITDGYEVFNKIERGDESKPAFVDRLYRSGLYDNKKTKKYVKKLSFSTLMKEQTQYLDLNFIRKDPDSDKQYETTNLAHCFSRKLKFTDFLDGMSSDEIFDLTIDGYHISDFMVGSSKPGMVKTRVFEHLPLDVNFVIKHKNRGKIESHLWFFKGFCQLMKPDF